MNWTLNSVSGLFVSTPVVKRLGFKRAIIVSFWGYSVQILSLFLAVYFPKYAWTFGLIGAVIAGFTSAIWWTAQGVCFELSCANIQCAEGTNPTASNNINNNIQIVKSEESVLSGKGDNLYYTNGSNGSLGKLTTLEQTLLILHPYIKEQILSYFWELDYCSVLDVTIAGVVW